jgi:hypothetical protein
MSTTSDYQLRLDVGKAVGKIVVPASIPRRDIHIDPENFEEVASYNWLDKNEPTILVPGKYCF